MKMATRFCMTALLGLCVAGFPAIAQDNSSARATGSTMVNEYRYEVFEPVASDANRIAALQQIVDADLGADQIAAILPLLRDLRDAKNVYRGEAMLIMNDLVNAQPGAHMDIRGTDRLEQAYHNYHDHSEKIWQTVTDRVGADKAGALRRMVEATEDTSFHPQVSERIRRIDTMIAELDRAWSQRIAGTTGTTDGTVQATFDSTTTRTTDVAPTVVVYTRPVLGVSDLVDLLEAKLVALNADPTTSMMVDVRQQDLTSPWMSFVRQSRIKMWE